LTDYLLDGGIDPPHFYYTDDEVRQALQAHGTHPLPQFGHPHPAPAAPIEAQPVPGPVAIIPIDPILMPPVQPSDTLPVQPSASGTALHLSAICSY
jgi:hypothetical protein